MLKLEESIKQATTRSERDRAVSELSVMAELVYGREGNIRKCAQTRDASGITAVQDRGMFEKFSWELGRSLRSLNRSLKVQMQSVMTKLSTMHLREFRLSDSSREVW